MRGSWGEFHVVRYRSRLEIVADILGVVREGAGKTAIMYQANLSYKLLVSYLKYVIDMGLVRMESGKTYELTEKGSGFLREFENYHERRVEVEKELGEIEEEKMLLEDRFLNAKSIDAGLKNNLSERSGRKKAA